jgi:hypothetical protein
VFGKFAYEDLVAAISLPQISSNLLPRAKGKIMLIRTSTDELSAQRIELAGMPGDYVAVVERSATGTGEWMYFREDGSGTPAGALTPIALPLLAKRHNAAMSAFVAQANRRLAANQTNGEAEKQLKQLYVALQHAAKELQRRCFISAQIDGALAEADHYFQQRDSQAKNGTPLIAELSPA